ncbi:MAG: alpha/beta hydrolase [Massilia sp.]|nr:alpha/beta hydrolase [Massilia sp.]
MAARSEARRLRDTIITLFDDNGGRKVHLVAHSMGSLLARPALADYGAALSGRRLAARSCSGAPHRPGCYLERAYVEEPGYWRKAHFTGTKRTALQSRLANGEMPGFHCAHIV